jgi:hypothetical protein
MQPLSEQEAKAIGIVLDDAPAPSPPPPSPLLATPTKAESPKSAVAAVTAAASPVASPSPSSSRRKQFEEQLLVRSKLSRSGSVCERPQSITLEDKIALTAAAAAATTTKTAETTAPVFGPVPANGVVCIDNGSSFLKVGLAGETHPRFVIPTVSGYDGDVCVIGSAAVMR